MTRTLICILVKYSRFYRTSRPKKARIFFFFLSGTKGKDSAVQTKEQLTNNRKITKIILEHSRDTGPTMIQEKEGFNKANKTYVERKLTIFT
jgi:hypothetical protein